MSEQLRHSAAIARAKAEITAGKLRRAKEILSGQIGNATFSAELFAAYGRLLALMRDDKLAGMYLFLSGDDSPGESQFVALFEASIRGKEPTWIFSQFPVAARLSSLEAYPERVRLRLLALGFTTDFKWMQVRLTSPESNRDLWLALVVSVGIAIVAIIGVLNGLYVVGGWLLSR